MLCRALENISRIFPCEVVAKRYGFPASRIPVTCRRLCRGY
jgi:hypothetical protein